MISGHIRSRQNGTDYLLHPGTAILNPPLVGHQDIADTAYSTNYVIFEVQPSVKWNTVLHDDENRTLERITAAIVRDWRSVRRDREEMLYVLCQELVLWLNRASTDDGSEHQEHPVTQAMRIIEARYSEKLSVPLLASEVGVCPATLHAQFLVRQGATPMHYLQSVRLHNALALLHGTSFTLEAIAERCGYHSASHISRHVKAVTGVSPGQLRRMSNGNANSQL